MAAVKVILEKEESRAIPASLNEIYFWRQGGFYRAYNWSAFVYVRYIYNIGLVKERYTTLDKEGIFVGFPLNSLKKYTPDYASVTDFDEINKILTIPAELVKPDAGSTFEQDYKNWFSSVKLSNVDNDNKKVKDKGGKDFSSHDRPLTMSGIMQEILKYPLLKSSPLSTMEFVADVQQRLSKIL